MSFDENDFYEALNPKYWIEEQILHLQPDFEVAVRSDKSLVLSIAGVEQSLDAHNAIRLTRFLSMYVPVPPEKPIEDPSIESTQAVSHNSREAKKEMILWGTLSREQEQKQLGKWRAWLEASVLQFEDKSAERLAYMDTLSWQTKDAYGYMQTFERKKKIAREAIRVYCDPIWRGKLVKSYQEIANKLREFLAQAPDEE